MDADAIDAAARLLVDNRRSGLRFGGFPAGLGPHDEAAGYALQERVHDLWAGQVEGAQGGHKIGCTTRVMQDYLGIANPCAGGVLARSVVASGARVPLPRGTRLGVECEIGVRLDADLSGADAAEPARVAAAVGAWMATIEIVEDRYEDYGALDAPTLIADDFFNAGLVLGPAVSDLPADHADGVAATMAVDGRAVGRGTGADILGHPLEALGWLGRHQAQRGRPLRRGELVTLGSLVATVWIDGPCEVVVDNDRLGRVEVAFTEP